MGDNIVADDIFNSEINTDIFKDQFKSYVKNILKMEENILKSLDEEFDAFLNSKNIQKKDHEKIDLLTCDDGSKYCDLGIADFYDVYGSIYGDSIDGFDISDQLSNKINCFEKYIESSYYDNIDIFHSYNDLKG